MGLNDQSLVDVRKVLTGKDGQLFVTVKGQQYLLSESNEFSAQLSINNTDYQPSGSSLVYAINTGFTLTLTLTEVVIRDDLMLLALHEGLKDGRLPWFDFSTKLRGYDGSYQRQTFPNCAPDGSIDLVNIKPGELVQRPWSFRCNAIPELLEYFKSA
ncbi:phage tail tube protein [Eubacterium maltosivorans]|uniref:phage tail tube protein n=1 Tax=Eubacterium maltosivorans TaxID=2041044 RepID=UPI00189CCFAD|nr:phage tail tube protein [Eubacterium maltosivorans]